MKIGVVSFHYEFNKSFRPNLIKKVLERQSFVDEMTVFVADFSHIEKRKKTGFEAGVSSIPVRAYDRNISFGRFWSYITFAWALRRVDFKGFDLLIVEVPDYASAALLVLGKRKFGYKLIIDVVDLWPEALPLGHLGSLIKFVLNPAFRLLRWGVYSGADKIVSQSTSFSRRFCFCRKIEVLPMAMEVTVLKTRFPPSVLSSVNILYLGSLNSITDIDSLVELLLRLSAKRRVRLAVIGGGEGLFDLKRQIADLDVDAVYHGITFDETLKAAEYAIAHFGYNGYKLSTDVAISYKSIEYWSHSIPILSSVRGDTASLINDSGGGYHFSPLNLDPIVDRILNLSDEDHKLLTEQAFSIFNDNFSMKAFSEKLISCVEETCGRSKL